MPDADAAAARYLDLLKRAVHGYLQLGGDADLDDYFVDDAPRYADGAWRVPLACRPHSVLHRSQLDLLEHLVRDVERRRVDGDLMEAGIWRGGAVILLLGLVDALGLDRRVIAADTFAGIPRSDGIAGDPVDAWPDRWTASLDEFRAAVDRYGLHELAERRLTVLAGRIPASLDASSELPRLALLRVDVDSYESTKAVLTALYPRLQPGGVVLIDDWHLPGCVAAVAEFRLEHGIEDPVRQAAMNAYWRKSGAA